MTRVPTRVSRHISFCQALLMFPYDSAMTGLRMLIYSWSIQLLSLTWISFFSQIWCNDIITFAILQNLSIDFIQLLFRCHVHFFVFFFWFTAAWTTTEAFLSIAIFSFCLFLVCSELLFIHVQCEFWNLKFELKRKRKRKRILHVWAAHLNAYVIGKLKKCALF